MFILKIMHPKWLLRIDNKKLSVSIVIFTLLLGVFLRYYVSSLGHNFDFESYKIVGDIAGNGGNVYLETTRYNYGPVWFTVLGFFHYISNLASANQELFFRFLIVSALIVADIALAFLIKKRFGLYAFLIFFLNPISIIITGFHNQFDNIAILIGLLALIIIPAPGATTISKRHFFSAMLLGISLMTKHIFFILPLWLFIREENVRLKVFMSLVPVAIFIIGFVPFIYEGGGGILQNVFLYKSIENAPLLTAIFSTSILSYINPLIFLILALAVAGFMTRRLNIIEAGLWYLLVLVAFSPAVANQYLAIVMPAVAALGFIFFLPFVILSLALLAVASVNGLHIIRLSDNFPQILKFVDDGFNGDYKLIILTLFLGMILAAIYRYRRSWYMNTYQSIVSIGLEQWKQIVRP